VGPATSDYVARGLNEAQEAEVSLILLRMDTPGGLDTAMREIIKAIIASPIPVVTYVAPSGARAASAGTYILYASHVAAMAPGTNLGAATPVQIGGNPFGGGDAEENIELLDDMGEVATTAKEEDAGQDSQKTKTHPQDAMSKKIINDAEAYIRSLAEMHGRNVTWATQAVREAASLTAQEALEKQVIEIVATDVDDLLTQLDGRDVKVLGKLRQLSTTGLVKEVQKPDWRNRLLAVITDPNIAYILMLLGIYGLFFELAHPGSLFPGVLGGICLLLALFAFQVLPVNYAGFALILLGIGLIVGEAFMPSFGILGIGGITAFIIGSIILMDSDLPGFEISRALIATTALFTAGLLMVILKMAMDTFHKPVVSGREEMIGAEGECLENDGKHLTVYVHSERWNASSSFPIKPGQRVRVTGITGLILSVEPTTNNLNLNNQHP
jgi:membrane-bound serine protease (ClpP class)